MQFSTKVRYGLALTLFIAKQRNNVTSTAKIAQTLGLSKIYLEQILRPLKSHRIVESIKGPNGGYRITDARLVKVSEIFDALEPEMLFEQENDIADLGIRMTLNRRVYQPLTQAIKATLEDMTLEDLILDTEDEPMYFI
jgi:Rrf2 family iron-sulfur cluster assembly transcriptional regulator